VYDGANRLTQITLAGETFSVSYDANGNLSAKTGPLTGTTTYTWSARNQLAALAGSAGAGDDESVFSSYANSAYGETVALGPDGGNPLQYTGRENDGTGLYYYRARYYAPLLKQFIAEDPIGIAGGLNLAGYVRGNPISFADPLGLQNILIGGQGSLVVGLGISLGGGILINPGLGNNCFDIGVYGDAGAGGGLMVGAGVQFGYAPGPSSNVSGVTLNYNYGYGPGSVTIQTDPNNPDPILAPTGGSVGVGIGLPAGVSVTANATATITLNRILSAVGMNRCGCLQ
jgi:RHS repeat-associated protein